MNQRLQQLSEQELVAVLTDRLQGGLAGHLGVQVAAVAPGLLTLQLTIQPHHMAANGYLHAGTVITLADTACGFGCIANLPEDAQSFTTIELKSNFLRTATQGVICATATLSHGGRRTQVWDATVSDGEGRAMALFRCTQMLLYG